jgi:hypothetical protein
VTQALRALDLPLWTCEAVLTEASHLTGKPAVFLAMIGEGSLKLGLNLGE